MPLFEFDPAKSAANMAKHGISFDDAQALWHDDRLMVRPTRHVLGLEERWLAIGRIGERMWTAVVTFRGETTRIISVRRSRDDEVGQYDGQ